MSERDFAMALALLAEAFGEKHLTTVRIEAYHRSLSDVPLPLLNAAVRKAIETRAFFPKVSELRADAETCRREVIAAHPYLGCCECEMSVGWRAREDGPRMVEPCPCKARHAQKLASLGVAGAGKPIALPAASEDAWAPIGEVG